MIALGKSKVGEYEMWVTTPIFTTDLDPLYYEVLLTHIKDGRHLYVDINKFLSLNLADRNPLHARVFGAKPKKSKDGEEIEYAPLTPEEVEFREEFQSYQTRKDMGMPLWKLSRRHTEQLLVSLEK